jgi:hypothetical protein
MDSEETNHSAKWQQERDRNDEIGIENLRKAAEKAQANSTPSPRPGRPPQEMLEAMNANLLKAEQEAKPGKLPKEMSEALHANLLRAES